MDNNNNNPMGPMANMMDFAMAMAMSNQINAMMSRAMSFPQYPAVTAPPMWYALLNGQSTPMSFTEIRNNITNGIIKGDTYLWHPGMPDWAHANEMPELATLLQPLPPPAPPVATPQEEAGESSNPTITEP